MSRNDVKGSRLLCLDPALEDHHVVGDDLQSHVTLAAGCGSPRQGVALVPLDHRIAGLDLPSAGVAASSSGLGRRQQPLHHASPSPSGRPAVGAGRTKKGVTTELTSVAVKRQRGDMQR